MKLYVDPYGLMSDELYHHGVKGQKKGVRRYQYPDGRLTPEGYIHYGISKKENASKGVKHLLKTPKHGLAAYGLHALSTGTAGAASKAATIPLISKTASAKAVSAGLAKASKYAAMGSTATLALIGAEALAGIGLIAHSKYSSYKIRQSSELDRLKYEEEQKQKAKKQNVAVAHSEELYHHGVKGQKWGVRRWQYADGSLTPEGYIHYGYKKRVSTAEKKGFGYNRAASEANVNQKWFISNKFGDADDFRDTAEGIMNGTIKPVMKDEEDYNDDNLVNRIIANGNHGGYNRSDSSMNFNSDNVVKWNNNCMNCAVTAEMRRRGYPVFAGPDSDGDYEQAFTNYFHGAKQYKDLSYDNAEHYIKKMGRNASAVMTLSRYNDAGDAIGGHAFYIRTDKKGNQYVIDAQSNKIYNDLKKYLKKQKASLDKGISFTRVDNCEPNLRAMSANNVLRQSDKADPRSIANNAVYTRMLDDSGKAKRNKGNTVFAPVATGSIMSKREQKAAAKQAEKDQKAAEKQAKQEQKQQKKKEKLYNKGQLSAGQFTHNETTQYYKQGANAINSIIDTISTNNYVKKADRDLINKYKDLSTKELQDIVNREMTENAYLAAREQRSKYSKKRRAGKQLVSTAANVAVVASGVYFTKKAFDAFAS